jgi:adhesin transport system outer membrane protein
VEKSEYYPSLDIVGAAEYEDNTSGVEGSREIYSLFLRSRWEFFSGLKSRARVDAASRTYEASKSTHVFTIRKVDEEVRIAWENLQTQQQRVELLENAVSIAEEVLRARRQLREAGKETALNVLDAEGEVFNAQINRIEAEYDARLALYRVIFATGQLNEKTLGLPEG